MLQVGNGGTSGSIQGDVAKDGVLVFHRSDDIAFAGAIGGNGNIRHLGGGKTELTADSSGFGGTTDIEAGTLAVNGALGGAVTVLAGGRLQGPGTGGATMGAGTTPPRPEQRRGGQEGGRTGE